MRPGIGHGERRWVIESGAASGGMGILIEYVGGHVIITLNAG